EGACFEVRAAEVEPADPRVKHALCFGEELDRFAAVALLQSDLAQNQFAVSLSFDRQLFRQTVSESLRSGGLAERSEDTARDEPGLRSLAQAERLVGGLHR